VALEGLDGLILTGGDDVDPALYGETPGPELGATDIARDRFELALIHRALAGDVPILAICRGMQVLNVACGGTLVQDIPSQMPTAVNHRVAEPRNALAHEIWVSPGTRLSIMLKDRLDSHDACSVNSRHHQAVKRVAEGFDVSATAPDGVVEAMERRGSEFCIGVQWHPENFWRTGEFRAIFEAFLAACRS
jgi:putative glutamine amidotransferase